MDLGLAERLVILSNGGEVVNFFDSFFECLKNTSSQTNDSNLYQPIALLLLDINMPLMNGMDVCKRVKEIYKAHNSSVKKGKHALRPVICYLSQYQRAQMQNFIQPDEQADVYLEKPLPIEEIQALMKLLNIQTS